MSALSTVGKSLLRSVRDMIEHDLVVRPPRPRVKPKIARDNPGGDWLKYQRERAAQSATKHHPVTGAVTAYTRRPIELDPRKIRHLPGARGERRVKGETQYDRLHEDVKRSGGLFEDAPILIGVNHDGKPYIIEGNTRTAVADDLGIRAVPAEVRYFAGGEERADEWAPGLLEKYMAPSELVSSPRFQRWFDGSSMVDEYGEPIPLFHGTNKDFSAFRRPEEDVGIHMGTSGQANDRMDALSKRWLDRGEDTPRILPVYANFRKPYRMEDIGNFDFDNMTYQLGDLKGEEVPFDLSDVHDLLGGHGYDGIVYKNTGETAGAGHLREAADEALSRWQELYAKYTPNYKKSHGYAIGLDFRAEHPDFDEAYSDYKRKAEEYQDFRERNAEDSFAAFYPTQIKSRFNRGTFDPYDPDILKAEGGLIR